MSNANSSAFTKGHKIVVFGASGHTGRFVVAELARRGVTAILAGRDSERLAAVGKMHPAFEIRVASVDDPVSLEQALLGGSLVINCAGPFLDTGKSSVDTGLELRLNVLESFGIKFSYGKSLTDSKHAFFIRE